MYCLTELTIRIVLAHFVSDFLLQPKEMAVRKSEKSWTGLLYAVIHCIIYALILSIFISSLDTALFCWLFLSHFMLDRFSLTMYWLKMIKGRDLLWYIKQGNDLRVTFDNHIGSVFASIVYVVADATLHFLLLGAIFKWIV